MTENNSDHKTLNGSLTYRSYLFMLRISEAGASILSTPKELLLESLLKIQQDLQMNELEIALFSIYLEKFGWRCTDNIELVFLFAGYTAKCFLNEKNAALESNLHKKYPFFTDYQKWIFRFRNCVNIGYIEINYAYMKLNKADATTEEVDAYDYNSAVMQLIEASTRPEKIEN